MKDKIGILILCIFITILGLRFVFQSLRSMFIYVRLKRKGQLAKAEVIGFRHQKLTIFSRGGDVPILTFKTNN